MKRERYFVGGMMVVCIALGCAVIGLNHSISSDLDAAEQSAIRSLKLLDKMNRDLEEISMRLKKSESRLGITSPHPR